MSHFGMTTLMEQRSNDIVLLVTLFLTVRDMFMVQIYNQSMKADGKNVINWQGVVKWQASFHN
jgi:hypothetical protein